MNANEFKTMLVESAKKYIYDFNNDDVNNHPYKTGCDYGRYEMAKNILGHFEDLLKENDIISNKK